MYQDEVVARLASNAEVFRHLLSGVREEQAGWKPAPEKWSLLEVVCHLADEEREDFRQRLDLTLHRPGESWPPIDPGGWVVDRGYARRKLDVAVADLLAERTRSVDWLRGLAHVQLDAAYAHPTIGVLTAGDLLASWLAHDLIHIRQLTRLHYEYFQSRAAPCSVAYAGPW
jgi:hypothetical protein